MQEFSTETLQSTFTNQKLRLDTLRFCLHTDEGKRDRFTSSLDKLLFFLFFLLLSEKNLAYFHLITSTHCHNQWHLAKSDVRSGYFVKYISNFFEAFLQSHSSQAKLKKMVSNYCEVPFPVPFFHKQKQLDAASPVESQGTALS